MNSIKTVDETGSFFISNWRFLMRQKKSFINSNNSIHWLKKNVNLLPKHLVSQITFFPLLSMISNLRPRPVKNGARLFLTISVGLTSLVKLWVTMTVTPQSLARLSNFVYFFSISSSTKIFCLLSKCFPLNRVIVQCPLILILWACIKLWAWISYMIQGHFKKLKYFKLRYFFKFQSLFTSDIPFCKEN